ncbi:MAG: hypothetical protein ACOCRO_04815 [Halanaerobiales bacterium]
MNLTIKDVPKETAIIFVKRHHYSKIMPRLTKRYLGVFSEERNNEVLGIITLGWGTQPKGTIRKLFYNHELESEDYFEIGKMAFLPEMNGGNFGSQVISQLVKHLKNNEDILFLYTLADGIMGKCGYVYQASNFKYMGSFKTYVYLDKETGEKIHPRSARKLLEENAEFENKEKVFWLTDKFCKHKGIDKIQGLMFRYIYPLNKKAKKILKQYPEYLNNSHPKDDSLIFKRRESNNKYVEIDKPNFNMDCFNHNFQKGVENKNNQKLLI